MPTSGQFVANLIDQVGFQIFNDDSGPTQVNNASARAAQNAGASVLVASKYRVRLRLKQYSGNSTNYYYLLEFRVNGGAWAALDAATSVRISLSTAFADAQATTQRLGSGPFVGGEGIETNRNSAAIAINSGGGDTFTEIEWNVLINSGAVGDVIQFRAVGMTAAWTGGAYTGFALSSYPVYAQITVSAGSAPSLPTERAMVFEGVQIGLEGTPGVAVPATQKLLSLSFELQPNIEIKPFRPNGYKYNTTVTQAKEWSEGSYNGPVDFNHLLYVFASILCAPVITTPATNGVFLVSLGAPSAGNFTLTFNGQTTATIAYNATAVTVQAALEALSTILVGNVLVSGNAGGPYSVTFQNALETTGLLLTGSGAGLTSGTFAITTTAATNTRRFAFSPSSTQPDTVQAMTIEKGSSIGAAQAAYMLLNSLTLKLSETEAEVSGSLFARTMVEPFSMTAGVPELPETPGDPARVSAYMGDSALNMPRLTRCDEVEWELSGRFHPRRTLNDLEPSFSYYVEKDPEASLKLMMQHNSDAIGYLQKLRQTATQFVRIVVKGSPTETGFSHRLMITCPVKLLKDPRADKDDTYESTFEATIAHDRNYGKAIYAEVDCLRTAL